MKIKIILLIGILLCLQCLSHLLKDNLKQKNKNKLGLFLKLQGTLTLRMKNHQKLRVTKFLDLSQMKRINIQLDIKKKGCFWNTTEMEDIKPNYPKFIKSFYKFSDQFCIPDENFEQMKAKYIIRSKYNQDCLSIQDVRNKAICTALEQKVTQNSAVYYVNTMRIQSGDNMKAEMRKDYLNQFTFAILPADKDTADDPNYIPKLFTVVVPIDPYIDPYTINNCIFDYSKFKEKDIRDDKDKKCDFSYDGSIDYDMKLSLTDLHAQYWANKELDLNEFKL